MNCRYKINGYTQSLIFSYQNNRINLFPLFKLIYAKIKINIFLCQNLLSKLFYLFPIFVLHIFND